MRNVSLRAAAVVATLVAAAPAAATNGMRMIGFSPVQNSMGGAGVAAPLDAATIVTNPAGLTALERRLDASVTFFMPSPEYDATWTPDGVNLFPASQESERPTDFVPTLGAVFRPTEKLGVGVAFLGTSGMGAEYPAGGVYGSSTMTSYLNMRLAPAAAYRLTDRLSIGLTANLMYAQMEYEVAGATGMQPRDAAGAVGYGATLGLTYQAPENVTLAVAYETKSEFEDFEFDIPAHTVQTPGGPANVPGGTEKLAFDQPDALTVGLSFRPVAPLLCAVDVQWIRWSRTNGENLPAFTTDPNLTGAMPWNLNWSDQMVLKIGAQFDVTKALQVRAGYNYGENPLDPNRAFENIAFPALAEHHFTLGGGFTFGAFTVDAAFMYSPEASIGGSNFDQGIASYETRMSQLAFDLGATWKF